MKMTMWLALPLTILAAGSARAEGSLALTEAGMDVFSAYVWRGYEVADKAAVQPTATIAVSDTPFALNLWGSFVVQERSDFSAVDEVDATLSLNREVAIGHQSWALSGGGTLYTFPGAEDGYRRSEEVFASATMVHPLAPSVRGFYDFGLFDAAYVSIGVAPAFRLSESLAVTLAPSIGLGDADTSFGLQDATLAASTAFEWSGVLLRPTLGYSYAPDTVNPDEQGIWGGVGVRFVAP
ncbi:MAG: hypothetical protein IPK72_20475 [Candidatus Eisenbacteria bacterium]|nr:hypothetical protein [Candidatus Eisenbacteria bacterium]